jgi:hypothetical protein
MQTFEHHYRGVRWLGRTLFRPPDGDGTIPESAAAEVPRQRGAQGIYLLVEGLAETLTDSQALLHVREMREYGIVDFEIWALAYSRKAFMHSLARWITPGRCRVGWSKSFVVFLRGLCLPPPLGSTPFSKGRCVGSFMRARVGRGHRKPAQAATMPSTSSGIAGAMPWRSFVVSTAGASICCGPTTASYFSSR